MGDVYNTDFSEEGYDGDKNKFDIGEHDGERTGASQPLRAGQIIGKVIRPVIDGIKALGGKGDNNSDENK